MSAPQDSVRTRGKIPGSRRPRGEPTHVATTRQGCAARETRRPMAAAPPRLTADDVMTGREVAELLHVPASTVEDLARRGDLPSVKVGRRRRYVRQQVEAVLIGPQMYA
jgi:excisionase family DNA binding protein